MEVVSTSNGFFSGHYGARRARRMLSREGRERRRRNPVIVGTEVNRMTAGNSGKERCVNRRKVGDHLHGAETSRKATL